MADGMSKARHCDDEQHVEHGAFHGEHWRRPALRRLPRRRQWRELRRGHLGGGVLPRVPLPLHHRRPRRRHLPGLRRAVAPAADTDAPPSSVGLARIAAAGGQRTRDNAAYSAAF